MGFTVGNWHWKRFFAGNPIFPSAKFHLCSTLVFILSNLVSEGKAGADEEPSNNNTPSDIRNQWMGKYSKFHFNF
jgi:hypothetical protein